jgi:hypothetical protein
VLLWWKAGVGEVSVRAECLRMGGRGTVATLISWARRGAKAVSYHQPRTLGEVGSRGPLPLLARHALVGAGGADTSPINDSYGASYPNA